VFWNINEANAGPACADLVRESDADILAIAEPPTDRAELLTLLCGVDANFRQLFSPNARVTIFSRVPAQYLRAVRDNDIYSAWFLDTPLELPVLLIVVHFWSKAFLDDDEQATLSYRLREEIDSLETLLQTDRTIVVGDLNMDPYSRHIANSEGLHSVMCRHIAARGSRVVKAVQRRMFYNPMWSLLGDHPGGPPGTYFFDRSGHPVNMFWHSFDQVLLRPSLLDEFCFSELRIVTTTKTTSLVNGDGAPAKEVASDHLPIVFSLQLKDRPHVG